MACSRDSVRPAAQAASNAAGESLARVAARCGSYPIRSPADRGMSLASRSASAAPNGRVVSTLAGRRRQVEERPADAPGVAELPIQGQALLGPGDRLLDVGAVPGQPPGQAQRLRPSR